MKKDEILLFLQKVDSLFHIKLSDKTVSYYSDYSSKIVYNNGKIVRVLPVDNKPSVDEQGNINPTAKKSSIKITKIEETNHGTITYYSDHSSLLFLIYPFVLNSK